jgi:CRP-like cAMP-binding protein
LQSLLTKLQQDLNRNLRMDIIYKTFIDHFSTNLELTENTKAEICVHLSILNLDKKHILIKENQRHDFAYFVIKGAVRSYYLKDGVEVNTWFALENDMVGSLHNFKDNPSRETIELIENSTLISINLKQVKPLMFSNIQIANFINAIIEDYALFLEDKIYFSQMMSSTDKYLILLEKEPQLFQRIPLTYIASFLGISRETLSRLRAK